MLQALLGVAALLLQFALPAVHRHPTPAASDAKQIVAHDALACPICAAVAQGHGGAIKLAPAPLVLQASHDAVAPPLVRLLAAPALTRAAPRAPPALA